jgi:hypothetical protein
MALGASGSFAPSLGALSGVVSASGDVVEPSGNGAEPLAPLVELKPLPEPEAVPLLEPEALPLLVTEPEPALVPLLPPSAAREWSLMPKAASQPARETTPRRIRTEDRITRCLSLEERLGRSPLEYLTRHSEP